MPTRSTYWLKQCPAIPSLQVLSCCGSSVRAASLEDDGRPQSPNASSSQQPEKLHSRSTPPSMIAARIASTYLRAWIPCNAPCWTWTRPRFRCTPRTSSPSTKMRFGAGRRCGARLAGLARNRRGRGRQSRVSQRSWEQETSMWNLGPQENQRRGGHSLLRCDQRGCCAPAFRSAGNSVASWPEEPTKLADALYLGYVGFSVPSHSPRMPDTRLTSIDIRNAPRRFKADSGLVYTVPAVEAKMDTRCKVPTRLFLR